jgi:hypothetical protein
VNPSSIIALIVENHSVPPVLTTVGTFQVIPTCYPSTHGAIHYLALFAEADVILV